MLMKDIYRNPMFYYILVPLLIGIWPLSIWLVYLPRAEESLKNDGKTYEQSKEVMERILTLDPTQLELAQANTADDKFDYNIAVDMAAAKCGIVTKGVNVSPPRFVRKQQTQDARVTLENVDITGFAKFITSLQIAWPSLQCEKIDLAKKPGAVADQWNIDVTLKYYY
jgi:hypothetical protein